MDLPDPLPLDRLEGEHHAAGDPTLPSQLDGPLRSPSPSCPSPSSSPAAGCPADDAFDGLNLVGPKLHSGRLVGKGVRWGELHRVVLGKSGPRRREQDGDEPGSQEGVGGSWQARGWLVRRELMCLGPSGLG